jgi:hypothetical protein
VPGERRAGEEEQLGGAERIPRPEGERQAQRQRLQEGPQARGRGEPERGEALPGERGVERAGLGRGDDGGLVLRPAAQDAGRELAGLEGGVRLEEEERAVSREPGAPRGGVEEGPLQRVQVRARGGEGGVRRGLRHLGAGPGQRVEEPEQARREALARRGEPDRQGEGQPPRPRDGVGEPGEQVGEARREGRSVERLEGGEVLEPAAPGERAAAPAPEPQPIAEREQVGGDAGRVGPARGGVGARPVVVEIEAAGPGGDAVGQGGRLPGEAEDAAHPAPQAQGPGALPAGARLPGGEPVAPGRAAVRGREEDGEHVRDIIRGVTDMRRPAR